MDILHILLSSLAVFLSLAFYLKHKNPLSTKRPILRNLLFILRNRHRVNEVATALFQSLGDTYQLKYPIFTSVNYVVTCDPYNIEYILKTNFPNFRKGPDFIEIVDIFGDGIFTTDSHLQLWPTRKKALHTMLISKDFRIFLANVSRWEVETLLPLVLQFAKEGSAVDLQDVFLRFTYDIGFTMIFGRNPKLLCASFPVNEFAEAMDVVMETTIYRHLMPSSWWKCLRYFNVGWERTYSEAVASIDHIIEEMISVKKEAMAKGIEVNDLLSACIKSQVQGDVNDKFIRDFVFNVFFAASDTTASGLTWFFWLICQTPAVEAKILDELNHLVSEKSNTSKVKVFDQEQVKRSVYLHAAICESLRLCPPVFINHKAAAEADVLPDGTKIKPGSKVIVSVYVAGRSKKIWGEDSKEFKPERWINEDGKLKSEFMSKFFIFNLGPRSCMGQDMAFIWMKLVAANILFNFRVQVVECKPDSLKQSILLFMKNGMKVKITERMAP